MSVSFDSDISIDAWPGAPAKSRSLRPAARRRRLRMVDSRGDYAGLTPADVRFGSLVQLLWTGLPLLLSDLTAVLASVFLGAAAMSLFGSSWEPTVASILLPLVGGLLLSNAAFGLYPGTGLHPMVELRLTSLSIALTNGLLLSALLLASVEPVTTVILLQISVMCLAAALPVLRAVVRRLMSRYPRWGQSVLILGDGETALGIFDAVHSNLDRGLRPIGILGDPTTFHHEARKYPYLGPISRASEVAAESGAYWAIVSMPDRAAAEITEIIDEFATEIPYVLVVPKAAGMPSLWSHAFSGTGLSGILFKQGLLLPLPRFAKRAGDMAICLIGGVIVSPLLLLIAALIKLTSPGPVVYKQRRIGQNGRHFNAWKFRTMVSDADQVLKELLDSNPTARKEWDADHKLKNDPRVTRIGHWLRKTSLDELPQVWNALKGEMSLVGPRPIVDAEVEKYGPDFELYAKVRPGISGLWQISGRNDTTYQQRVDLDSYYVRNWSPWMDVYILVKTIGVVVRRDGAY